uniref:hypothetical protein n=1 Tax=Nonomuraea lactucae TaxID=2249762 RepID=UPI001964921B
MADRSVSVELRAEIGAFDRNMKRAQQDVAGLARGMTETGASAQAMRRKLESATRALPKIKIDADSSAAEVKFAELRRDLEGLASKRIGIDVDAGSAQARLQTIERELAELAAMEADPLVKADIAMALDDLRKVNTELDRLDGRTARVDVDVAGGVAAAGKLKDVVDGLDDAFAAAGSTAGSALAEALRSAAGPAVLGVLGGVAATV